MCKESIQSKGLTLQYLDRKSTSGTCHLLGSSLISWNSKKQACVALSIAQAEYIVARHACAQSIWLKHQLMDYGVKLEKVPLYCDNTSAINLIKNPIQHSKTKHINIRHHLIRDHIQKGDIEIMFVKTKINWQIYSLNHLHVIDSISFEPN